MARPIKSDGSYDQRAHAHYLKGAREQNPLAKSKLQISLDELKKAVNENEQYARAKSELSYSLVVAATSGHFQNEAADMMVEADTLSTEAMNMEWGVNDYQTYWSRAFYLTNSGNIDEFDDGIAMFEKSIEVFKTHTDPMDRRSGLYVEYGEALVYGGEIKKGIEMIEKALTPPDWYYWVASFAYFQDEQYEKALEMLNNMKMGTDNPEYPFPALLLRSEICRILEDETGCVASIVEFMECGCRFLDNQTTDDGTPVHHDHKAVETVFLAEFETSGFRDDGNTEISKQWRSGLKKSIELADVELKNAGIDVDWIKGKMQSKV